MTELQLFYCHCSHLMRRKHGISIQTTIGGDFGFEFWGLGRIGDRTGVGRGSGSGSVVPPHSSASSNSTLHTPPHSTLPGTPHSIVNTTAKSCRCRYSRNSCQIGSIYIVDCAVITDNTPSTLANQLLHLFLHH